MSKQFSLWHFVRAAQDDEYKTHMATPSAYNLDRQLPAAQLVCSELIHLMSVSL